jgi:hypothetical protein
MPRHSHHQCDFIIIVGSPRVSPVAIVEYLSTRQIAQAVVFSERRVRELLGGLKRRGLAKRVVSVPVICPSLGDVDHQLSDSHKESPQRVTIRPSRVSGTRPVINVLFDHIWKSFWKHKGIFDFGDVDDFEIQPTGQHIRKVFSGLPSWVSFPIFWVV